MKKADLIKKIRNQAKRDQKLRRDPRHLNAMGLLLAKGLLHTNQVILPTPNKRITIRDALWAGTWVEPRILEVLPAAVIRFKNHFDIQNLPQFEDLHLVITALINQDAIGPDFMGIPYEKLKVWVEFKLPDQRLKLPSERKKLKTFRLDPKAIETLKSIAIANSCTETEALEKLILERA